MERTLLDTAAKGDTNKVKSLLKGGSEVDVRNESGVTPLMEAAKQGNLDTVNLLLESGADVNANDRSGITALMRAASWGHTEVVHCLLNSGAQVNTADKKGTTALLQASTWGQHDVVGALLERGADVDSRTFRGTTSLMRAAKHGHANVVHILLDHGAEIDAKKRTGSTALLRACSGGHTSIVQDLLQAGANVDQRDRNGHTALIRASLRGRQDLVSILLDAGADPYARNKTGKAPLSLAAMFGYTDVVRELLDWQSAHPAKEPLELETDDYGDSPLLLAARTGRINVVRLLLGYSENDINSDHPSEELPCSKRFTSRNLLSSQLNIRNGYGDTALIEAARQGHNEIVQLLVAIGADPNTTNLTGRTALMVAVLEGNHTLVGVLLDHGAKSDVTDAEGETAFSLLARKRYADIADLLHEKTPQADSADVPLEHSVRVTAGPHLERHTALSEYPPNELLSTMVQFTEEHHRTEPEGDVTSRSEVTRATFSMARIASEHDSAILLLGESGSGKDFLAQYIHKHSAQACGPFRALNCAALPRELAESELFGHEKGAFTGAARRKRGIFELGNGGTVFLNEVGDMPLELQTKLLTFLDTHRFQRVGGEEDIESDARIIAATNKDLKKEVGSGNFRLDLYHRLAVWPIRVPPLRERVEDIPLLTKALISKLCAKSGRNPPEVSESALYKLCSYSWEGNVRELKNCLERALIFCRGDSIESKHICVDKASETENPQQTTCAMPIDHNGKITNKRHTKPDVLELRAAYESYILKQAWTRARLAEHLGIDSSTLKKWFKDAGLPAGTAGRPKKKPGA